MNKVAIDTNIFARYFLQELNEINNSTFEDLLFNNNSKIYIDILVISELIYLMTKTYKKSRKDISDMIQILIFSKNTVFDKVMVSKCLEIYLENSKIGFVDIMTYLNSVNLGYSPLLSFDRALQNFDTENVKTLSKIL